jgi:plastocyanin
MSAPSRQPNLVVASVLVLLASLACVSERQALTAPDPSAVCGIALNSPIFGSTQALVAIRNYAFGPDTVRVRAGTTVTWVNCEQAAIDPHTTTSDTNIWASLSLTPGTSFSFTFNQPGRYAYLCVPHPFMRGMVLVE